MLRQFTEDSFEWEAYREKLQKIALFRLPAILSRQYSVEDIVQQTFLNSLKREDFFTAFPNVPVLSKLRMILIQTINDLERQYLVCKKRDLRKEIPLCTTTCCSLNVLASTVTSPRTRLIKEERNEKIRNVLRNLPEKDRIILEMRHFEDLTNDECAGVLGISRDAASIRYIRALSRMRNELNNFSDYQV